MARQGFDALCVDLQHGTAETGGVLPMLQAISQTDTVVRVAWNEPAAWKRAPGDWQVNGPPCRRSGSHLRPCDMVAH